MRNNLFIIIFIFIFLGCQDNDTSKIDTNKEKRTIYTGGWPFNPQKDLIDNPGFGECPKANGCACQTDSSCPPESKCTQLFRGKYCVPNEGSIVPRFKGVDQFGEEFDLYDLAMQGKPILLEIGSVTAQACQDLSAWRSHQSDIATKRKWWKDKFFKIRELANNQEILWINIIHLDENKNPANPETVNLWHSKYPNNNIIVLADPGAKMKNWIRPTGLPCMVLIDENMVLQKHALRGVEDAIDALYDLLNY